MTRLLLLITILTGCGVEQACQSVGRIDRKRLPPRGDCTTEQVSPRVHPKVEYAIQLFSQDALKSNTPCYRIPIIGFKPEMPPELGDSVIGYCTPGWEVRLLAPYWDAASATTRLVLVYHELGHCALGLEHVDGEPDIMNSYLLNEQAAEQGWDELVIKMMGRVSK